MRFRSFGKIISVAVFLLAAVNMFSACGSQPSPLASAATPQATVSGQPGIDPMGKYDPGIDITFVRCVDEDLVGNVLPKCPGESIEDNRWTRLYKQKFGIDIHYAWTVNGGYTSEAYAQRINVTLASGNLPDVVIVNATQLKQLTNAGMITDLTSYFNDYSTVLLKKIFADAGPSTLDSATFGGKLMAVPYQDDAAESAQYLWIRTDWLKKLGLEPPGTMDDMLNISEAFTMRDPDGNGINDTYGLAITKDLYSGCMGTEGFFAGYHAYPNMWITDTNGRLAYGSIQPEVKAALQQLSRMYQSRQIDGEFGVKDASKVAETIAAGKVGIEFGEQWNPLYPLIYSFNNDANADWTGYSIVSADEKPVKMPLKFRVSTYYAVNKGYEHPEAVIKLLNLFADVNCGDMSKTSYDYYFNPAENRNVSVWKFSPMVCNPPLTNYTSFLSIEKARQTGDVSAVTPAAAPVVKNLEAYRTGDKSKWGWEKIYGSMGVFRVMKEYLANNMLLPEPFAGAPTKTMVERKAALDKMEKEIFLKIIMGAAPIEEFDGFVSDWNKLGGEAITREVNEWAAQSMPR